MAWSESKAWNTGTLNQKLYQALLDDAAAAPTRNAKRKKIVHPDDMPWEMARQGLLKHLVNEGMNTRMETVEAYMQIVPPGSRSGKHRHLAEEWLYVVEGHGFDLHQDCDVEITDTYHWRPQEEIKRYEWEAGDVIALPVKEHGITFRHNSTGLSPVRMLVCWPNFDTSLAGLSATFSGVQTGPGATQFTRMPRSSRDRKSVV